MTLDKGEKRRGLRDCHDGSKCERIAMSVMPVSDSADCMTKDFDGRLRNVFVIVGRTRLAEILQMPGDLLACLDVQFRANTCKMTECHECRVGPTTASAKPAE